MLEETATRVAIMVGMTSTRSRATKTTNPEIGPAKALHGSGCARTAGPYTHMTTTTSPTTRQRVQDALATFVESDQNDNSYQYFRASDLQEIDPQVCGDESAFRTGLGTGRWLGKPVPGKYRLGQVLYSCLVLSCSYRSRRLIVVRFRGKREELPNRGEGWL